MGKIHGHETKLITVIKVEAGLTRLFHVVHSISQAGTKHALKMRRGTVSPNCKFKDDRTKKAREGHTIHGAMSENTF